MNKPWKLAVSCGVISFVCCSMVFPAMAAGTEAEGLEAVHVSKKVESLLDEVEMAAIPPAVKKENSAEMKKKDIGLYQEAEMAAIPGK